MELSGEEKIRYSRQISIEEIGEKGQLKLISSSVFVVGCGALGSMISMQLAGAGVGRIGIADFDTVDVSNLQRQFFFRTEDAGKEKVILTALRMGELNPGCKVSIYKTPITPSNVCELLKDYDFIVDATDNVSSKRMIEDACFKLSKPCCIAGVSGFRGQIMTILPGSSRFSDLFPDVEDDGILPCSIGGVAGSSAALCASVQTSEVIKCLTGIGTPLISKVFVFDLLSDTFSTIRM